MVPNAFNLCVRPSSHPPPNYAEAARNVELCPLFSLRAARRALTQHRKLCVPLAATQTFTPQCTHMHTRARTKDTHTCARAHAHMHTLRRCRWTREIFRSRVDEGTAVKIPRCKPDSDLFRRDESLSLAYIFILPRPPAVVVGQDEERIQMGPRKCFPFFRSDAVKTRPISRFWFAVKAEGIFCLWLIAFRFTLSPHCVLFVGICCYHHLFRNSE